MHLSNQTLNSFSTQMVGVSFNSNIFEANVVNLIILVGALAFLGGNILTGGLNERQERVLIAIQESEERLEEALARLGENKKQLAQAQIVIASLKRDAEATAKKVKVSILTEGKAEIERLTAVAKTQIITSEAKIRQQISDYIVALALQRVTLQLEGKLSSSLQQQIIDKNISKLSA